MTCHTVDVRIALRFDPCSDLTQLVCGVRDDDGSYRRVIVENLPSSSAPFRVQNFCALALAVAREEAVEPSTDVT